MSPLRTRADLLQFADQLLDAVEEYRSDAGAQIVLPGPPGGYGRAVDGLEGFARTFLLFGMRLAGEQGTGRQEQLTRFTEGLIAGVDPAHPERWVRPSEHGQAKVEAASLALVLDWTRPWLWDRLDARQQQLVVDYLAEVVGDTDYPATNWLWFQIVVETFLRSVGGPSSTEDISGGLQRLDSFYAGGGWYRDGQPRAFDHYSGWAMQLYPVLWTRMAGAEDLTAGRAETDRARLDRYLQDLLLLTGADGAPLHQGRSLTYRFAAAGPLWAGAMAQVPSTRPGRLRERALAIIDYFRRHGVPNARGLLDIGWWGPWPPLSQSYSGTGSPYWAAKGFLGLLMPPDHPVWTEPAPAEERSDQRRLLTAPGWALSATAQDGIARIANHGTDHAEEGADGGDSPWYARLAYSTASFPLADEASWHAPVDQSVVLVDPAGRRSHRTGMRPLALAQPEAAVVAASRAQAHWLTGDAALAGHGSGASGTAEPAGEITVISLLRAQWEVRLIHVAGPAAAATRLEAGGWALAEDTGVVEACTAGRIDLCTLRHTSSLVTGPDVARLEVVRRDDASALGRHAAVPVALMPARPGWSWIALALGERDSPAAPQVALADAAAQVRWPDAATTHLPLSDISGAAGGER